VRRLVLLASLLLASQVAPADADPGRSLPTLGSSVTLSGSAPGFVRLKVTRPARLADPLFRRGAVQVSGGRTTVGFALVQEGGGPEAVRVVGGRFRHFDRLGAPAGMPFLIDLTNRPPNPDASMRLPVGTYRLYLVTDGPATVRFRFSGVSGSRSLVADRPARAAIQQLDPSLDAGSDGAHLVYTAGDEFSSRGSVLHFHALLMRYTVHTESAYVACTYFDQPQGPDPYLPGCPSVGSDRLITPFVISDEYVAPGQLRAFYGGLFGPAGHYGNGGSLVSATPAEDLDDAQFWVQV
jgi:hypothetical protein